MVEIKVEHCKNCKVLTPFRGNILGIKRIKGIKTRNDLVAVLGNNFKVRCHICGCEENYIDKEIVAINNGYNNFYGLYGLIFGFLSLLIAKIYKIKTGNIIFDNNLGTLFMLTGILIGIIASLFDSIKDKRKVEKFNES